MHASPGPVDEIGPWSEIKLEIIRKYAAAYSTILAKQPALYHVYVDAFAGGGLHRSRTTGRIVPGSPVVALQIKPRFREYHFIDLSRRKVLDLQGLVKDEPNVFVYPGDCNQVLLQDILPRCRYQERRRALWLLDPNGLHYNWRVVAAAGREQSVELFLNLPIMDIHRTVGRRDPSRVPAALQERMTAYWGDESWKDVIHPSGGTLFEEYPEKAPGGAIADAYRARLGSVAGFRHVSEALPMRNARGAVVYYLVFASHKPVAAKIVTDIFAKYRDRGQRPDGG